MWDVNCKKNNGKSNGKVEMILMFKYFIWDVGGSLFDTVNTSARAFVDTFAEFGISVSQKDVYRQLRETSTAQTAAYFSPEDKTSEILARYREIEKPRQENPEPFADTAQTLADVIAHGGKNYIVSNRDLQVVDFLEERDVIQYFSYVITSNDHFPRKPDPRSLNYLVERFGVGRAQALVIGDRELDIMAAQNAGMKSALYAVDDVVQVPAADFVIHHLHEALTLPEK
jgi:HAD superfamily hydrolase (TIGR01549 family)